MRICVPNCGDNHERFGGRPRFYPCTVRVKLPEKNASPVKHRDTISGTRASLGTLGPTKRPRTKTIMADKKTGVPFGIDARDIYVKLC